MMRGGRYLKRSDDSGRNKQGFKLFLGSETMLQMSQRTILSKSWAHVYARHTGSLYLVHSSSVDSMINPSVQLLVC